MPTFFVPDFCIFLVALGAIFFAACQKTCWLCFLWAQQVDNGQKQTGFIECSCFGVISFLNFALLACNYFFCAKLTIGIKPGILPQGSLITSMTTMGIALSPSTQASYTCLGEGAFPPKLNKPPPFLAGCLALALELWKAFCRGLAAFFGACLAAAPTLFVPACLCFGNVTSLIAASLQPRFSNHIMAFSARWE